MSSYQLLPPLSDDEYEALKADIAVRGVIVPILLDEEGNILDGHHRVRAWDELTRQSVDVKDYPTKTIKKLSKVGKLELVKALNLHRRHLTPEQRREQIAKLRETGMSVREIAEQTGTPKSTVADAIKQVSETGQVKLPEKITGKDGKNYGTTKPKKKGEATESEPEAALEPVPGPVRPGDKFTLKDRQSGQVYTCTGEDTSGHLVYCDEKDGKRRVRSARPDRCQKVAEPGTRSAPEPPAAVEETGDAKTESDVVVSVRSSLVEARAYVVKATGGLRELNDVSEYQLAIEECLRDIEQAVEMARGLLTQRASEAA